MPKVSVIIPVYGVEKYIERCARSLFEQTLDDIEYIFVNDCTKDKSMEILNNVIKDYPEREKQIIIHNMPVNSGASEARIWGMKHSTGDYIINCDSDDWVEHSAYKELYEYCIKKNLDFVWFDLFKSDKTGEFFVSQKMDCDRISLIKSYLTSRISGYLWLRMCRRELYLNETIVDPNGNMTEDLIITMQLTLLSKRPGYYQKPLYHYCYNPNSITKEVNQDHVLRNHRELMENTDIIISLLEKYNLEDECRQELVCKKCTDKEILKPILKQKTYRKLWIDTHSEINGEIMSNPYISNWLKFKTLCYLHNMVPLFRTTEAFKKLCGRIYRNLIISIFKVRVK